MTSRRLVPFLVVALVALMGLPTAALVLAGDSELSLIGFLLWLASVSVITVAGIVGVTQRLLLARRWGRLANSTFELSNVANAVPGNGDARSLVARVVAEADERAHHLVLRVASSNQRAVALYRHHGFVETERAGPTDVISMERSAQGARVVPRRARPMLVVGVVAAGVIAFALTGAASSLTIAVSAIALAALGAAGAVDQKTMRIPNVLLVMATVSGVVLADATNAGLSSLAGVAVAAAPLLLIHLLDPGALGFGDVKFAATSGLVVGAIAWPAAILVPIVGLGGVAIVRIVGPAKRRAFGPYLMTGTSVALIAAACYSSSGAFA